MNTLSTRPYHRSPLVCIIAAAALLPLSAQAAALSYALNFTDQNTGATGIGSFVWDTDTEIMSSLTWTIGGHTGSVLDSALADTYHSYDPLAGTYGELFYRYFTAPQDFLIAQLGLTGHSVGMMPYNVSSDYFGFVGFGAEDTSPAATYIFYDQSWNVATEGYVTASTVPLPAAVWLLGSALAGMGAIGRRKVA